MKQTFRSRFLTDQRRDFGINIGLTALFDDHWKRVQSFLDGDEFIESPNWIQDFLASMKKKGSWSSNLGWATWGIMHHQLQEFFNMTCEEHSVPSTSRTSAELAALLLVPEDPRQLRKYIKSCTSRELLPTIALYEGGAVLAEDFGFQRRMDPGIRSVMMDRLVESSVDDELPELPSLALGRLMAAGVPAAFTSLQKRAGMIGTKWQEATKSGDKADTTRDATYLRELAKQACRITTSMTHPRMSRTNRKQAIESMWPSSLAQNIRAEQLHV